MNVSRDPATQQSAGEMHALCIYSVQLPPGPSECPSCLSTRVPKAKTPGTNNTVLPINENGELKGEKGTQKALLNFRIHPYRYLKTQL